MSNYKKIGSITVSPTLADPDGTQCEVFKRENGAEDDYIIVTVTITEEEDGNEVFYCDKTYEELIELLKHGKKCKLYLYGQIYDYNTWSTSDVLTDDKANSLCFSMLSMNNSFCLYGNAIWICKSGNVIYESATLQMNVVTNVN